MKLAAYLVCGKYAVLQLMMERDALDQLQGRSGYSAFFVENWAASILRTHDALVGFIHWHRQTWPTYYGAYDRLQKSAAMHRTKVFKKVRGTRKPCR